MRFVLLIFLLNPLVRAGETHALLIGVSDYGHSADNLPGVTNDLVLMAKFLRDRYPKIHIERLYNETATHQGVITALEHLQQRPAEDRILIYYSGHGSQVVDGNGDEADGRDETWVTYGARRGILGGLNDYDILDDQLHDILGGMQSEDVIVITDACHSGSGTRHLNIRAMGLDQRQHPLAKRQYSNQASRSVLYLGAARDREAATEAKMENGLIQGVFTWFLVQHLSTARPTALVRDLIQDVAGDIARFHAAKSLKSPQRPQVEGPNRFVVTLWKDHSVTQREMRGQVFAVVQAVYGSEERRMFLLDQGRLAGVLPDSVFSSVGEPITRLRVRRVEPNRCLAVWFDGPKPKPGTRFFVSEWARKENKRLLIALDTDLVAGKAWIDRLQDIVVARFDKAMNLVDASQADHVLHIRRQERFYQRPKILPASTEKGGLTLWIADGKRGLTVRNPLLKLSELTREADLVAVLSVLLKRWDLRSMVDEHPVEDQFSFRPIFCRRGETSVPNGFELKYKNDPRLRIGEFAPESDQVLPLNTILCWRIENRMPVEQYFYVVNLNADGTVSALFPNSDLHVDAALLPAAGVRYAKFSEATQFTKSGFEEVIVLMSRQPIDVNTFFAGPITRNVQAPQVQKVSSWCGLRLRWEVSDSP